MNNYIKYFTPISLSALLIACGSSGGSGKGDNNQPPSSQPNQEISQPSIQDNNKQSADKKEVVPTAPIKEQLKLVIPPATQADSGTTVEPSSPIKEQAKPMTPPATQADSGTAVEPSSPIKEQAKPITPPVTQVDNEKANEEKPAPQPLDIPSEINKLNDTWFAGGGSEYSKDKVRIYRLIENDKNSHDNDSNIKEIKPEFIQLSLGVNKDNGDYVIKLLDENFYYGYYRDSIDKKRADVHYIYSFKESAENKGNLSGLTATYQGEFIYSLKSNPDLPTRSNVYLQYENGEAKGKVTSTQVALGEQGRDLFHINSDKNNIRTLIFNPATTELDNAVYNETVVVRPNSPDRIAIETHFINSQDGTENKHLVGKGGNEKYWGILGATKVKE